MLTKLRVGRNAVQDHSGRYDDLDNDNDNDNDNDKILFNRPIRIDWAWLHRRS